MTKKATTEESSVLRSEGGRPVRRRIQHYNLDGIISVGYRVKSQRGTQFRIWATNTLRDHLIQGYTLSEKRRRELGIEAEQALNLISSTLRNQQLVTDRGQAVLNIVERYARSWRILRDYDEDQLPSAPDKSREGQPLYPTIESRAAHLLYFVIKDHPLSDGNKRSGSLLFLDYLHRNNALLGSNGQPRFSDTALVALALLIAESQPSHKELVIRLVLNLLAEDRP